MLKLPKSQKKKKFKKNTIERTESMIIAFLLLKLARQLNVLQKMN